ncbi:unnamed protein product [Caenorhabditis auriculariae]|uniref:Uncharacterized protein n=1 Tax=Caenorhabditis auriculariae TaxID=2777116 RepID=A0A8S1HAM9_9PELO|nr:unnamed protein product [Caenorhabditis auriculariae]
MKPSYTYPFLHTARSPEAEEFRNATPQGFLSTNDDEDMASVSIRVHTTEGADVVVAPSDTVDPSAANVCDRRSSSRDSRRESSNSFVRRSRASSAFGENGDLALDGSINRARKTQSVRNAEPGLRSMLYGLDQKLEKEEAEAKKLQKKMLCASDSSERREVLVQTTCQRNVGLQVHNSDYPDYRSLFVSFFFGRMMVTLFWWML